MDKKRIGLADVALRLHASYGESRTYRHIYTEIVNGSLPATKRQGRWYVDEADLPKIAERLGIAPASAA